MSIASEITRLQNAKSDLKTSINAKLNGTAITNETIDDYASFVDQIQTGGGGVSTQSQSIFTGYTAPLTWLNSTNNVFTYESATHNITITGLDSIATISGNGTKSVTVTIDTTANANRQTAFTISCSNGDQTLSYNGIEFHYGSDLGSGNCLAVAQTIANDQIAYVFIESVSLPLFSTNTTSWNGIYSHQLIGFDFGKLNSTSIGNSFLSACYSFIYLEYNTSVYPTDNNSLSQNTNTKTSANGTGVLVTGTHASDLKAALPDRTSSPYRKLVLAGE